MKKEIVIRFYAVTESGGIYKVEYDPETETVSVRKVFCFNPTMSKVQVSTELFPAGKFVAITNWLGLVKYLPDDGKRTEIEQCKHFTHTSLIVGLFFERATALVYCRDNYRCYKEEWYNEEEESKKVLEAIGENHPVFTISMKAIISH